MTIKASLSSLLPCGAIDYSLEFRATLKYSSPQRGETQLLLIKGNVLELYEISLNEPGMLYLYCREVLSSKVIDAKVNPALDNLFLMFPSGNVSILGFNSSLGEFVTLSLHDWSSPPLQTHSSHTLSSLCSEVQLGDPIDDLSLHGSPSHRPIDLISIEPGFGRVACVRRGQRHLAFLPRGDKNTLHQSHLTPITMIDKRIRSVVRFSFLPSYQRPTMAILYEANETFPFAMGSGHPAPQNPSSIPRRRMDTINLIIISITKFSGIDDYDLNDGGSGGDDHISSFSRSSTVVDTSPIRFTTILHFEGLPTTARGMTPIYSLANRGILLNGANELLYLDLQSKGGIPLLNYLPLNSYAPLTSRIAKGAASNNSSLRKSLIIQAMSLKFQTSMEKCCIMFNSSSSSIPDSSSPDLLLSSDDGNWYSLWLGRGGGGGGGGKIVLLPSQSGSIPSIPSTSPLHLFFKGSPILHLTTLSSIKKGKEFHFVHPVCGDSLLLVRDVGDSSLFSLDGHKNAIHKAIGDDDADDPYAMDDSPLIDASKSNIAAKRSSENEGELRIHSILKNHAPVNDMVPLPDGDGIAVCGGYGRMSFLRMYHTGPVEMKSHPLTQDSGAETKRAKRLFNFGTSSYIVGTDNDTTFILKGGRDQTLKIPFEGRRSILFSLIFESCSLQVTTTSIHFDFINYNVFNDVDSPSITRALLCEVKHSSIYHLVLIDSLGIIRQYLITKDDTMNNIKKIEERKHFFLNEREFITFTIMDDIRWACAIDKNGSFVAWNLEDPSIKAVIIESWALTLPLVAKNNTGGAPHFPQPSQQNIAEICGNINRSLLSMESMSIETSSPSSSSSSSNDSLLILSLTILPYPLLFKFSPLTGILRKWKTSSLMSGLKDWPLEATQTPLRPKKVYKSSLHGKEMLYLMDWYSQKEYYTGMVIILGKEKYPRLHPIKIPCPKMTKIQSISPFDGLLLLGNGRIMELSMDPLLDLDYHLPFTEKIIEDGYWMKSIEYHLGSFAITTIADDHNSPISGKDGASFTLEEDEYSVISDNQNFPLPIEHLKTSQGKYFLSLFTFDPLLGWMIQDKHLYPDEELDALWVRTLQPPPVINAPGSIEKQREPEKASSQEKALRYRLANSEAITCMSSVPLETRSVREGQKPFLCIGTSLIRGEDRPCRGYVLVLEVVDVVPPPGEPWRTKRFKPICLTDMKGPVTELSSIQGGGGLQPYLLIGLGPKALISNLECDEALEGVAFVDVGICVSSLAGSLKAFFASGDVVRGLSLWAFQEKPPKILSLARDDDSLHGDLWHVEKVEALTTPTIKGNVELGILAVDPSGSLRFLQYVPGISSQMIGGARLIPSGSLQLTSSVKRMRRFATSIHGRQGNIILQSDGTILKILPIPEGEEESSRRLSLLQGTLFSSLLPLAGLHPIGGRSIVKKKSLSDSTNVLDGSLGWIDMTSSGLLKLFDLPLPAIKNLCMIEDKFESCLPIIDGMMRKLSFD